MDCPTPEPTGSVGFDDAYLAVVHLKDVIDHELWLNGRAVDAEPMQAGKTYFHDLKQDPRAVVRQPAHVVHFYLPLATLNAFAAQHDAPVIAGLVYKPGAGRDDPVIRQLSGAVLAALEAPPGSNTLLLDQLLNAVCAHTLDHYGSAGAVMRRPTGGLTPWQERRAKEMMIDALATDISLSDLARECHLSVTHFVRAFRRSTGTSPAVPRIVKS